MRPKTLHVPDFAAKFERFYAVYKRHVNKDKRRRAGQMLRVVLASGVHIDTICEAIENARICDVYWRRRPPPDTFLRCKLWEKLPDRRKPHQIKPVVVVEESELF